MYSIGRNIEVGFVHSLVLFSYFLLRGDVMFKETVVFQADKSKLLR